MTMRSLALALLAAAGCGRATPGHGAQLQWTSLSAGVTDSLVGVFASGAGLVIAAGTGGSILRSTDDGATWSIQTFALPNTTLSFAGLWSNGTDVILVGTQTVQGFQTGSLIVRSGDGGLTFARVPATDGGPLAAVWGDDAGNVFAVGEPLDVTPQPASIERSTDGGDSFVLIQATAAHTLAGVGGAGGRVYAVGSMQSTDMDPVSTELILQSGDGTSWGASAGPFGATRDCGTLRGAWGDGSGTVYAVGACGGQILRSSDGGATWSTIRDDGARTPDDRLSAIWGTGTDDVFAVGSVAGGGGTVLHSMDGGATWASASPTFAALAAIDGTRMGSVFAVGAGGTILRGQ